VFLPVAGSRPIAMKLTVPFIKQAGTPEADNSFYQGLYQNANVQASIEVFDLQGTSTTVSNNPTANLGRPLIGGDWANRDTTDSAADYWIDFDEKSGTFRNGTIHINADRVPAGTQLRILYKAQGDWAVSIQKAAATYTRATDNGNALSRPVISELDAATRILGGDPNTYGQQGNNLYFHFNELNKSVVARIEYRDSGGAITRTAPIQMTIEDVVKETQTVGSNSYNVTYGVIDVSKYVPQLTSATTAGWRVVGAVSGVSIKARVIYRDAGASPVTTETDGGGTQRSVVNERAWRVQDVDTYLTRGSGS